MKILSGVFIRFIRPRLNTIPNTVKITDNTTQAISVVLIAVFIFSYCLPPKNPEITTQHPILLPMAIAINIIVIGYDAPIAANASSPANLPAITLSAMLYNC